MPLYEYECKGCENTVEVLVRNSTEQPTCPTCGSTELEKQISVAASPAIAGQRLPVAQPGPCGRPQCGSGCMFD